MVSKTKGREFESCRPRKLHLVKSRTKVIDMSMFQRFVSYSKDSYNELMYKVTWPKYDALIRNTVLVCVASIILTLVVFGLDAAFKYILELLYNAA